MKTAETQTTDPIGKAIQELGSLNDINDHISMRVILGRIVAACEKAACDAMHHGTYNTKVLAAIRECANGK
jgi:hypothetical protein